MDLINIFQRVFKRGSLCEIVTRIHKEEVYVKQSTGYVKKSEKNKVYRKKSTIWIQANTTCINTRI